MANRRNFLKNSLIGASILTIPKFSFGQVDNWENMDSISTSSEDDEKKLINVFENTFKNAKIGEEFMENLFVDQSYYEENYNYSKLGACKIPNYAFLDVNTHKLLTYKDLDCLQPSCNKYLRIPDFIVAAKTKDDSLKSLSDGYYFIANEIIKEMESCWAASNTTYYSPSQAKLVIMQKFGKYNLEYYGKNILNEGGIISPKFKFKHLIPDQDSSILAMRIGMCVFNNKHTMS